MIYIKSKDNEKIKYINQLLSKKGRDIYSSFLIEGERAILQAIDNDCTIEMICISQKHEQNMNYLNMGKKSKEIIIIDYKLFDLISDTSNSQGIIAVAKKRVYEFERIKQNAWHDILLLDRIQDPGNLGTIIRTAEAAGYNCILLTKGTVDPFSPKVTRSTVGANTSIPIIFVTDDEIKRLKDNGYKLIVTALEDDSKNYKSISYKSKKIIVMGNEANGVSKFILNNADEKIVIPIYGKSESLNVAIATAIILYESK